MPGPPHPGGGGSIGKAIAWAVVAFVLWFAFHTIRKSKTQDVDQPVGPRRAGAAAAPTRETQIHPATASSAVCRKLAPARRQ